MARTQAPDYEQRREAIVERAAELFATKGFQGASVAELAVACGASKSLFYHYYASKEDVLYAVMASHIDQLAQDVDEVLARKGKPAEHLDRLIHAFMRHYVGAAARQKVLLNELGSLPERERDIIVAKQRGIIEAVQALLVKIYPGLRKNPARARVQTMLLFGMINWTHTWFDAEGPISADDVADMVVKLVLKR